MLKRIQFMKLNEGIGFGHLCKWIFITVKFRFVLIIFLYQKLIYCIHIIISCPCRILSFIIFSNICLRKCMIYCLYTSSNCCVKSTVLKHNLQDLNVWVYRKIPSFLEWYAYIIAVIYKYNFFCG